MIAWHLAASVFLFRWIFRDPKVDLRFLAVGALLPDVIDLSAVTLLGGDRGGLWAHSLLVPSAAGVIVLAATRRGRRRRAWMALVVAWLFHILVDRMWLDSAVFLWPLFGWDLLESDNGNFWAEAWSRAWGDPWRWALEAVGLTYLVGLGRRARLSERDARSRLWSTGRIG